MSKTSLAAIRSWLVEPMKQDVAQAIQRLRRAPDVQQIAVMPDVHLAADVCIGVVVATSHLIYPQAVGGDIGCGMLAVALDVAASTLSNPQIAVQVLADIGHAVPARRRNRTSAISQPTELTSAALSHPSLESLRRNEGAIEFATLGSGNHFIELQSDEDDRLWLMIHSGSRALGQAICDLHLSRGQSVENRLRSLDSQSEQGEAYLNDAAWARRFADFSRQAMAAEVGRVLSKHLGAQICWGTLITTDHNHVAREQHAGRDLWIHRKGAMPAQLGVTGVLPGSMGSLNFHVEGRSYAPALCSSAHGAGRALSRTEARAKVSAQNLCRQMAGICYNAGLAGKLRDEAPSAYKDIRAVLKAQKELVKVKRTLRPVLNYKGV